MTEAENLPLSPQRKWEIHKVQIESENVKGLKNKNKEQEIEITLREKELDSQRKALKSGCWREKNLSWWKKTNGKHY